MEREKVFTLWILGNLSILEHTFDMVRFDLI